MIHIYTCNFSLGSHTKKNLKFFIIVLFLGKLKNTEVGKVMQRGERK